MVKRLAPILSAMAFAACGGGGSPTTTTPPTTLPACVQTVVFQGSGSLPAETVVLGPFSTTTLGRLDATVDWTFPATPIGVFIVNQATCDLATAVLCSALAGSETRPKPRRISGFNAGPGSYWLAIVNNGTEDDAWTGQVVLSSSTCPTIVGTNAESAQVPTTTFKRVLRR